MHRCTQLCTSPRPSFASSRQIALLHPSSLARHGGDGWSVAFIDDSTRRPGCGTPATRRRISLLFQAHPPKGSLLHLGLASFRRRHLLRTDRQQRVTQVLRREAKTYYGVGSGCACRFGAMTALNLILQIIPQVPGVSAADGRSTSNTI